MRKGLPAGFEGVLKKALSKDPKTRYQTCRELADDLRAAAISADETISVGLDRVEITGFQKKKRFKRTLDIAIAVFALLFAGVTGAYFFVPGFKDMIFFSGEKQEFVMNSVKPSITRSLKETVVPFDKEFKTLKESFDKGDFKQAEKIAQDIIAKEPTNVKARDYLEKSQDKIAALAAVSTALKAGIASYKSGNYENCQQIMRDVLKQDKDNKEAKRYIALASREVSKAEIKTIIERQRKTEEGKDLLTLLSDIGDSNLVERRKAEATEFFNTHDDVKSFVSKIDIQFQSQSKATVAFSNLVSAVVKATGVRTVVFEGKVTLTMEKQEKSWKIVDHTKKSVETDG
jgi:hypothetical protein